MRDAQLIQSFDIARRLELGTVVGSQSQTRSPRTERQDLQHGAVERCQSFFGAAAQTQVPATISRVQQSITDTRYAQPTFGPAQTLVMSDCQT